MKYLKPLVLLFAAMLAIGAITPPHAHAQVSVSFFYDNLDSYGEWVQDPDYGYCWHPSNVDENWAPYTDGYWAYTDGGWTWVSYEDYGGIVYHYGRWAHVPDEGWVWVPGTTWAPAWVSWRTGGDYVGWAPLPPEAHWRAGSGFGGWVDSRFDIGPGFYSFVNVGNFGAPALGSVIVNREQNVTIINKTTNITNITYNNSNVYTGGPSYTTISSRSSRPIPTLKLVRQEDVGTIRSAGGKILSRQQGNQLMVFAPKVTAPANGKMPAPSKVARTLSGVKADNGWGNVKDPQARQALETKFKAEGGNANTPARPVNPEDLKIVSDRVKSGPAPLGVTQGKALGKEEKIPKNKNTEADLENAPAAEQPGASGPAETPKIKNKKHALEGSAVEYGEGTPMPKIKKSKKAKTPGEFESGGNEAEAPKHAKEDSNLQPFISGGESKNEEKKSKSDASNLEEKPVKTSESDYEKKPAKANDSGFEEEPGKAPEFSEEHGGQKEPGRGEEPEKNGKKKKGKEEPTPN